MDALFYFFIGLVSLPVLSLLVTMTTLGVVMIVETVKGWSEDDNE